MKMALGVIRYITDDGVLNLDEVVHIGCSVDDAYNNVYCVEVNLAYEKEPLLLFPVGVDMAIDVVDKICDLLSEYGFCDWIDIDNFLEHYGDDKDGVLH